MCKNETFKVKLNSICPKKNSPSFEKSYHPILSVEARLPADPLSANPQSKQQPYHSKNGADSYAFEQARATIPMVNINLLQENLWGPKFEREITLDYSKLPALRGSGNFPYGWSKVLITVYVCDDTNRDGRCSDEDVKDQITLKSPVHQACHFPSAVPVEVYSRDH